MTTLSKALAFANYRATLNIQHAALRAKTENLLSYSINGGTFTIDPTLICFLRACIDRGLKRTILLDIYKNPIQITELDEFYDQIFSRYFEVTNDYLVEYEKLKKARKVHKILDLNQDGEQYV